MQIFKLIISITLITTLSLSNNKPNLNYLIFSTDIPEEVVTLEEASRYCEMITLYSLSDWQLPNAKELNHHEEHPTEFWSIDDEEIYADSDAMRQVVCVHHKSTPKKCYKFDKKYFTQTINKSEDIFVDAGELIYETKDNHSIYIYLDSQKSQTDLSCEKDSLNNNYVCSSEEVEGYMRIYLQKDNLYMKSNDILLIDNSEKQNLLKSKKDKFVQGVKTNCISTDEPLPKIVLKKSTEDDLFNASLFGDIDGILSALDLGANIDSTDNHGYTPLAVGLDNFEVVKLLLNYDADVSLPNDSILTLAIEKGNLDTVQILIDHGAEPTLKNIFSKVSKDNTFELGELFVMGDYDTVNLLIKNGANINIQDKEGYTPIDKAIIAKDIILLKTLIKNHAKVDKTQQSKVCSSSWIDGCIALRSR